MIRVHIESIPKGDDSHQRTIHVLEIENVGPTTAWLNDAAGHSDYVVRQVSHNPPRVFRVLAHRESLGVLELVDRAVTSLRALGAR